LAPQTPDRRHHARNSRIFTLGVPNALGPSCYLKFLEAGAFT